MDLGLAGRAYILTGGTRGLGRATAQALVAEGARVVVSSRQQSNVDALVGELGEEVRGIAADLADPTTADRLIATALDHFGRIDGALISVGGPPSATSLEATDDQWRSAFESVFLGAVRCARTVATHLQVGGALAFVLSTSVREPLAGLGISNGLRPGLAMVAKELASELGPRGIRVNGLLPGAISTDRRLELDGSDRKARARSEQLIPLGRYGNPEEFGRVAAFLLSPAASYLTGAMVPVDGGRLRGL